MNIYDQIILALEELDQRGSDPELISSTFNGLYWDEGVKECIMLVKKMKGDGQ